MPFEFKDLIAASLSAVTASIAFYNWRTGRRRAKLKDDLDILKMYREEFSQSCEFGDIENDQRVVFLRKRIQRRMRTQYVLRGVDHSEMVAGLALFAIAVIAVAWTAWTVVTGGQADIKEWMWALLAASGVTGIVLLHGAIKDRNEELPPRSNREQELPASGEEAD